MCFLILEEKRIILQVDRVDGLRQVEVQSIINQVTCQVLVNQYHEDSPGWCPVSLRSFQSLETGIPDIGESSLQSSDIQSQSCMTVQARGRNKAKKAEKKRGVDDFQAFAYRITCPLSLSLHYMSRRFPLCLTDFWKGIPNHFSCRSNGLLVIYDEGRPYHRNITGKSSNLLSRSMYCRLIILILPFIILMGRLYHTVIMVNTSTDFLLVLSPFFIQDE